MASTRRGVAQNGRIENLMDSATSTASQPFNRAYFLEANLEPVKATGINYDQLLPFSVELHLCL